MSNNDIIRFEHKISRELREQLTGHKGAIIWFTGLSGSGKSTIADQLEVFLWKKKCRTYILDGDNIRLGLNKDLGFSSEDRRENIRRISEASFLFADSAAIVITAFISPFINDRLYARNLAGKERFIEVYTKCPLSICEKRDPKNLYKKARQGIITDFTGIGSKYEEPPDPDVELETDKLSIKECVEKILVKMHEYGIISIS